MKKIKSNLDNYIEISGLFDETFYVHKNMVPIWFEENTFNGKPSLRILFYFGGASKEVTTTMTIKEILGEKLMPNATENISEAIKYIKKANELLDELPSTKEMTIIRTQLETAILWAEKL